MKIQKFKNDPVLFAEWIRTFEPLTKEHNRWVLESQISTDLLYEHYCKFISDLQEALQNANNVHLISWVPDTSRWLIQYKNGLPSDRVPTELIIDFLYNA